MIESMTDTKSLTDDKNPWQTPTRDEKTQYGACTAVTKAGVPANRRAREHAAGRSVKDRLQEVEVLCGGEVSSCASVLFYLF